VEAPTRKSRRFIRPGVPSGSAIAASPLPDPKTVPAGEALRIVQSDSFQDSASREASDGDEQTVGDVPRGAMPAMTPL